MRRILIVNVNWLGDTLFVTPFIRAVRENYKDAYIAVLTHPRCCAILEGNPHIDETILYDEKKEHKSIFRKFSIIAHLRSKKFDAAFILRESLSRTMILFLSGIPQRIGYETKRANFLLTRKIKLRKRPMHKVEHFLNIAKAMGIEVRSRDYEFTISRDDMQRAQKLLEEHGVKGEKFIAFNPGGNWDLKRWPYENFAHLGDEIQKRFHVKVVLTGAEKDVGLTQKISELMGHKPIIVCGKTDLKTLGALFHIAACVVSNDSGPMHIAVAARTKVIALFGPTSPALTGPYGSGVYKVLHKDIGCKIPCYKLECSDNRCMKAIKVEEVVEAIDGIMKQ